MFKVLGILPEYHVHYMGIRETSLKVADLPQEKTFFGHGHQVGKQASIYKATLHRGLGINNSQKTLSCSFGEHTLKWKSFFFF